VLERGARSLPERETLTADELPKPLPESEGIEEDPEGERKQSAETVPDEAKASAKAPLCILGTQGDFAPVCFSHPSGDGDRITPLTCIKRRSRQVR
jgi:hypothetical protein